MPRPGLYGRQSLADGEVAGAQQRLPVDGLDVRPGDERRLRGEPVQGDIAAVLPLEDHAVEVGLHIGGRVISRRHGVQQQRPVGRGIAVADDTEHRCRRGELRVRVLDFYRHLRPLLKGCGDLGHRAPEELQRIQVVSEHNRGRRQRVYGGLQGRVRRLAVFGLFRDGVGVHLLRRPGARLLGSHRVGIRLVPLLAVGGLLRQRCGGGLVSRLQRRDDVGRHPGVEGRPLRRREAGVVQAVLEPPLRAVIGVLVIAGVSGLVLVHPEGVIVLVRLRRLQRLKALERPPEGGRGRRYGGVHERLVRKLVLRARLRRYLVLHGRHPAVEGGVRALPLGGLRVNPAPQGGIRSGARVSLGLDGLRPVGRFLGYRRRVGLLGTLGTRLLVGHGLLPGGLLLRVRSLALPRFSRHGFRPVRHLLVEAFLQQGLGYQGAAPLLGHRVRYPLPDRRAERHVQRLHQPLAAAPDEPRQLRHGHAPAVAVDPGLRGQPREPLVRLARVVVRPEHAGHLVARPEAPDHSLKDIVQRLAGDFPPAVRPYAVVNGRD